VFPCSWPRRCREKGEQTFGPLVHVRIAMGSALARALPNFLSRRSVRLPRSVRHFPFVQIEPRAWFKLIIRDRGDCG
jgi:hypothetical protein